MRPLSLPVKQTRSHAELKALISEEFKQAVKKRGAKLVTYRVDGPGAASAPVSTDSWGTDVDFVDEFGGSKLDLADWSYRQSFYEPASKRECSKGDPKAVKVSGGTAKLSVLVDKKRNSLCKPKKPGKNVIFGKFKYRLNANIGTQAKHFITYGVVSARIKFQPLQGQHASLWMQPEVVTGGKDAKTAGSEIDIIEWFGKDVPNGGLTSFIYAPSYQGKKIPLGGSAGGGWIKKPEQYLENLHSRLSVLQTRAMLFKPYNPRQEARRMPDDHRHVRDECQCRERGHLRGEVARWRSRDRIADAVRAGRRLHGVHPLQRSDRSVDRDGGRDVRARSGLHTASAAPAPRGRVHDRRLGYRRDRVRRQDHQGRSGRDDVLRRQHRPRDHQHRQAADGLLLAEVARLMKTHLSVETRR